jgi:hypothetical protein
MDGVTKRSVQKYLPHLELGDGLPGKLNDLILQAAVLFTCLEKTVSNKRISQVATLYVKTIVDIINTGTLCIRKGQN